MVYVILHKSSNTYKVYLIDTNTMQEYDSYGDGLTGHGNSIAYDSKTEDVICPVSGGNAKLLHINRNTKKFENVRNMSLPRI